MIFFFAGESFTQNCAKLMETLVEVCKELGVPLAEDKTIGSTTQIILLGMEIDIVLMIMKIPQDKLERLKLMLCQLFQKENCFEGARVCNWINGFLIKGYIIIPGVYS